MTRTATFLSRRLHGDPRVAGGEAPREEHYEAQNDDDHHSNLRTEIFAQDSQVQPDGQRNGGNNSGVESDLKYVDTETAKSEDKSMLDSHWLTGWYLIPDDPRILKRYNLIKRTSGRNFSG